MVARGGQGIGRGLRAVLSEFSTTFERGNASGFDKGRDRLGQAL
jgi:hypothetical protein